VLSCDERCDHAQEAFELVAGRQGQEPFGTAVEERGEVGQTNGFAPGDVAQRILAEA
jgi:hypothetical protein